MLYGVRLRSEEAPSQAFLEAAIEEVTRGNVGYFFEEWQAGREPPCCLGCAEIRHLPDEPAAVTEIVGARDVLTRGAASCQSAAAYYAGRERALALWNGADPQTAQAQHRVVLEPRHHPHAPEGYWHALVVTPEGVKDVTEEMDT